MNKRRKDEKQSIKTKNPTKINFLRGFLFNLAERTRLELATPGVTGRYSNQLNYRSVRKLRILPQPNLRGKRP